MMTRASGAKNLQKIRKDFKDYKEGLLEAEVYKLKAIRMRR